MSNDLQIRNYLKRLRLPVVSQNYERLAEEAAANNRTFQDYLFALLEGEVIQREEHAQKLRLSRARFPALKTLDSFEFNAIPGQLYRPTGECDIYRQLWYRQDPPGYQPGNLRLLPGEENPVLHSRRAH